MLVKHRRISLDQRLGTVLPSGSLVQDTTLKGLYLGDGVTEGGIAISSPVQLQGPTVVQAGVEAEYQIVNYDGYANYRALGSDDIPLPIVDGRFTYSPPPSGVFEDYILVYRDDVGVRFDIEVEPSTGPGPNDLIAGDLTAGFYGELDRSDLIIYSALRSQLGISRGTAINNGDGWLKFALDGSTLFVMKKPALHSTYWIDIFNSGAVYGRPGDAEVDIGDYHYRVRLLKGADSDPSPNFSGSFNPFGTRNSEWSRLMYPIHSGVHTDSSNPTLPEMGTWAQYTDSDLGLATPELGRFILCQETHPVNPAQRVTRGGAGVTYANRQSYSSATSAAYGWRAVLELIP